MRRPLPLAVAACLLFAAPSPATDSEQFEKKVRPLLLTHCVGCHGPEKQKGGLRLDSRAAVLTGGDTGPAAKPGNAAASLLVQAVRYDGDTKMPPKGKLTADEIEDLSKWVAAGAPWPADAVAPGGPPKPAATFDLTARAKAHWSFHPVARPAVPEILGQQPAIRNAIDAFVSQKLTNAGLAFAPEADRRTLIRRVTFDLTGLPPTPEEVATFEADAAPDAYEKVVERLLASPHYGERWARHWLDLVRYAETYGHEFDFEIPDAWRYRDYVIRAFNADLPYDQFLREHLAGDLLPTPRRNPADNSNESIPATGFWFLHEAKHSPVDSRADQADRIDNQIDVFGKAVFGLTVACARCHDHKFDPVATKDYYALYGVLSSSRYQRAFVDDPAPAVKLLDELKAHRASKTSQNPGTAVPGLSPDSGRWRAAAIPLDRFDAGWRDRWFTSGLALRSEADGGAGFPHTGRESAKLAGALRSRTFTIDKPLLAVRAAGKGAAARVVLNGLQLIQAPIYGGLAKKIDAADPAWVVFDLRMWKGQAAYLELLDDGPGWFAVTGAWFADAPPPKEAGPPVPPLLTTDDPRVRELEARIPSARRAVAMADGTGVNEHVFVRGSHKTLGDEVPRRNLEAFGPAPFASPGSGRLELATAVTDPANPLVARVFVNRLWKHHFAEGIVRSPDDFGLQGQPPTHPELLDWLATEFVRGGWSVKPMHRLMVLSTTYRQASRATPEVAARAATADPQNKLLHRQNVRRLEAEAVRDALLLVSSRLDRTLEGPGVLPHLTEHSVGRGRPASGPLDGNGRRSIYLQVRRNFLNPLFVAFDYPTPFTAIGRRSVSNVPAQALSMLNNPFVIQQAELWAKRVLAGPERADADRVRSMYRAAFGRPPTPAEADAAAAFLADAKADPRAWADLAHVLLNTKEFILVE